MNINRHNYENFFLLYVDNELSASERNAVDSFVKDNPDLENELRILHETVLDPAPVIFSAKDLLLKDECISELQEKLLLLADDQLSDKESRKLRAEIDSNKELAGEWEILQRTKLPMELIAFPDKASLYRHSGKLVAFPWRRVAAAAILLGFGLWAGLSFFSDSPETPAAPAGTGIAKTKPAGTVPESSGNIRQPLPEAQINGVTDPIADTRINKVKDNRGTSTQDQKADIANQDKTAPEAVARLTNNLPPSYLDNINKGESNNTAVVAVQPMTGNNANPNSALTGSVEEPAELTNNNSSNTTINPYAQNAVYTVPEENNDRFLYMNEDKVKRSKLAGLFRKVKRVVERNTNIKTGNGIKVAGFEIAIK